jgi:hypothetical protein
LAKINGMLATLTAHGLTKELWDTEASWGMSTDYPDPYLQAAMVGKLYLVQAPKVSRFYWYGYEYVPWGTLVGTPAAIAYQEVQKWMTGASLFRCYLSIDWRLVGRPRREDGGLGCDPNHLQGARWLTPSTAT